MSKAAEALRNIAGKTDTGTPTKLPGIPAVPAVDSATLNQFLSAVKQILETRNGERGDNLDANVTWRDLIENQFAEVNSTTGTVVPAGSGSRGGLGADGFMPPPDMTIPPAPEGLEAVGALTAVILSWNPPGYNNHAYTEIWRAYNPNLGEAVLIGTSAGTGYVDSVGSGKTFYYWVRFVSTTNVVGNYNATEGTEGKTSVEAGYMLNVLSGNIRESNLYKALNERINLIDDPDTVPGSVAARIKSEAEARTEGDSALAAQIVTVSATASGAAAAVQQEAITRAAGDSANALLVETVQARLDTGDYSLVKQESSATASAVGGLQAQYTVKIDNAGHVSGFGLASESTTAGGNTSTFAVNANRFYLAAPYDYSGATAPAGVTGRTWFNTNTKVGYRFNGSSWVNFQPVMPFVAQTTDTTINGEAVPAGVYIDSAYIKNGSITNAQIGSLSVNKLTAGYTNSIYLESSSFYGSSLYMGGTVTYSYVNGQKTGFSVASPNIEITPAGAKFAVNYFAIKNGATSYVPFKVAGNAVYLDAQTFIADADITFAKISDTIQSTNYVANSSGWRLFKNGNAEFRNITARGDIQATSLYAATGTFSGTLNSVNGTFTGQLSGATGTFAGSLTAGTIDLTSIVGKTYTYAQAGSLQTIYVESGYTSMRVTMVGGGGAGGAGHWAEWDWIGGNGGGGGAGEYAIAAWSNLPVGAAVTIYVGRGGAGTSSTGGAGEASYINVGGARYKTVAGGSGGGQGGANMLNQGYLTSAPGAGGAGYPAGQSSGTGGSSSWGAGGITPSNTSAGSAGSGYGAGGGGGGYGSHRAAEVWPNYTIFPGGAGSGGKVIVEFYNANAVVLRTEFTDLSSRVTTLENTVNNGTAWQTNKFMTANVVGAFCLGRYYGGWCPWNTVVGGGSIYVSQVASDVSYGDTLAGSWRYLGGQAEYNGEGSNIVGLWVRVA